jgi:hypothetical protein
VAQCDQVGQQRLALAFAQLIQINLNIATGEQLGPDRGRQVVSPMPVDRVRPKLVAPDQAVTLTPLVKARLIAWSSLWPQTEHLTPFLNYSPPAKQCRDWPANIERSANMS